MAFLGATGYALYRAGKSAGEAPFVDDHTPARTPAEILTRLRKKATQGCAHPEVRRLGGELRDQARARRATRLHELMDLFFWVRDHVRWHPDPAGRFDYFAPAHETLTSGRGDCDDHAILMASLSQANGFETAFLLMPQHVVACVVLDEELSSLCRTHLPAARVLTAKHQTAELHLLPLEVVAKENAPGQLMPYSENHLGGAIIEMR